jgi:SAM-dependent methyltransferase
MIDMIAPIYHDYAPIYDAIGQHRFGERMAGWALRWLAARNPAGWQGGVRPARVLDLACGAGAATLAFAAAGCSVVGVDRSAKMLDIAQGKAQGAGLDIKFVQSDIRNLNHERGTLNDDEECGSSLVADRSSFDLVTCFYDSLNYLTEDGGLARVFAGAAAALRPGGYLICDLNTPAEYETWDERDVVTYDSGDCMVYNQLSYDPETRLAAGRIVWFVREIDLWWRGEETHVQRAWDDAEVRDALAQAGLELVGRLALEGAEVAAEAGDLGRVVYVARR